MLERIITGNPEAICTAVAFAFAASIFLSIAFRAMRMKKTETSRFSNLPFETPTPESTHERADEPSFH